MKETLEAVNKLIERNIFLIDTKRVRMCNKVKSSDRSKISFIWRSLQFLELEGILEKNGIMKPKHYTIKPKEKIDVKEFISQVRKNRTTLSGI